MNKFWKSLNIVIWISLFIWGGLVYYSYHHYPRGEFFSTGDYVCEYDGRGPCHEGSIEDSSRLDIPKWAKFVRRPNDMIGIFGLIAILIFIETRTTSSEEHSY